MRRARPWLPLLLPTAFAWFPGRPNVLRRSLGSSAVFASMSSASDFSMGCTVKAHSLTSAPEHNGAEGTLVSYHADKGRWEVRLPGSDKTLALKPDNLELVQKPPGVPDLEHEQVCAATVPRAAGCDSGCGPGAQCDRNAVTALTLARAAGRIPCAARS